LKRNIGQISANTVHNQSDQSNALQEAVGQSSQTKDNIATIENTVKVKLYML